MPSSVLYTLQYISCASSEWKFHFYSRSLYISSWQYDNDILWLRTSDLVACCDDYPNKSRRWTPFRTSGWLNGNEHIHLWCHSAAQRYQYLSNSGTNREIDLGHVGISCPRHGSHALSRSFCRCTRQRIQLQYKDWCLWGGRSCLGATEDESSS